MWNRNLRKIRSGAILAVVSCAVMPGQTACSLPIAISVLASAIVSFPAVAQSNQANHSAQSDSRNLEESEVKFEVLSIKSVEHGSNTQVQIQNPRPNGFTGTAYIIQWLAFAYGPPVPANQSQVWMMTEMRNAPKWASEGIYTIDARVSLADLKVWQNQDPTTQNLLHSALRAALKERFKLAFHEESATRPIVELLVAKRGLRLKPAAPEAVFPNGAHLPSGGVVVGRDDGMEFYGATMQDVAFRMQFSFGSDGPVRDRTGLIGRYDFRAFRVSALGEDTGFEYVIPGLEFKRSTEKGTILVIDHLEKPTAN